jgi:hypothetical protein
MIFKFNKVYIIESLPEDELKTGKSLHEDFLHYNDMNNEYGFEYQPIKNWEGLKIFFNIVLSDIKEKNVLPIIHLEMHGDLNGIQLGSGEVVPWSELASRLQKINIELKNKLIVALALCHGIHFVSVLYEYMNSRTPFAGLITSADFLKVSEIKYGFPKFYEIIINARNGNEAIKGLNQSISNEDRSYSFLSCRWLFKNAFIQYLKLCSAKERNKRTERIITNIKKTNSNAEITHIRKEIKQYLHKNNQKDFFESTRDIFLMYDLDESNRELFEISFQDVLNEIYPANQAERFSRS